MSTVGANAGVADAAGGGVRVAELDVATSEAMEALGERLGAVLRRGDLVLLSGELGAGKTTLTRGIGTGMRVRGPVTSPTFVLSRVHPPVGDADVPLVHVDAYRLGSAAELLDLDLDFEGAAVVVEWDDGLLDGVAESWLRIRIEREIGAGGDLDFDGDAPRLVRLEGHGPGWTELRGLA